MALKKYVSPERLAEYDALIKTKIASEDEATLSSSKTYTDEALASAKTYTDESISSISVPTKLSDLTEDTTHRVVTDAEKASWNAKSNFSGDYNDLINKPIIAGTDGLASTDYVDNKFASIDFPVDSVNGKTGAVALTASDVGAVTMSDVNAAISGKADASEIPTALSDLAADDTHRTVTDAEKATWNAKSNFSGDYNDLTNKPTIPSIAGLATTTYVDDAVSTKVDKVSGKGLSTNDYTTAEKNKLSGIAAGAEVNQNAFANVVVGSTTIAADSETDSLTIAAGTGITVSGDATNDKVTITNSGVRSISTGGTNGTISVNTNGASAEVAVKGLGSAAYTASTAYDAAGTAKTKADAALASANEYTDGKIELLMNNSSDAVDSIMELATAMEENADVVEALEAAIGTKANASDLTSHIGNKSNPHGVTLSQLGITATAAELNVMDGVTATAAEINKLDGVTATTAELNYVDGVTSNIQTQLDAKQATVTGAATTITGSNLTASRALISNGSGKVAVSDVTSTELGYLDGVTSAIQTQLDGKAASGHTHNYAGSSSAGGAATSANKVNKSLVVKLNSGSTEGTNLFTFNGSADKTVNITPSAIGAATSSHNHDGSYYTESEIDSKLSGKAPTSHASTGTGYGIGTGSNYGHVKLSDATDSTSAASAGIAASPAAVKAAYDKANHSHPYASSTHNHDDRYYTETEIDSKVTDLNNAISGKAESSHTHSIANVTNLQSTLDGKEPTINLTTNRALVSNGSGKVAVSAVTSTELGYLDGVTSNVQTQLNGKLGKTTYEYNTELALGGTGKVCIGKFPMYDSNISVEIKSTTSTTYNGTLVIATQNINTTGGGSYTATVYGDASNTLANAIKIHYGSGSNVFSVYIDLPGWSKNLLHIQCVSLAGTPTDIATTVTAIPSNATIVPTNALTANFAAKSHGNHVPTIETADNTRFLRNDNTWQKITPANIGAAESGHSHSGYVNQNAFSNIAVSGQTTVAADTTTDTLTLVAGSNVTITTDATNDKVTIAATDTNTHYTTGITAGASGTTTNAAATDPYVKIKDDSTHRGQIQIKGSGATTVKSDANGVITISSTDNNTTYTSLKNPYSLTIQGNGTTLTNGTYDGSAAKTVNITPASIGAAASSHGTHVPTPGTANNKKFLRNDNTWQDVTPANIGAATTVTYTATIPKYSESSGWEFNSDMVDNWNNITISVTGILATDNPIVDLVLSDNDYPDVAKALAFWATVYKITTAANSITIWSTSAPDINVAIQLKVVR